MIQCYVDSESKIQLLQNLQVDQYEIVPRDGYIQVDVLSSDCHGKYVENSYVLYQSLDNLIECLINNTNLEQIQLQIIYK